MTNPQRNNDNEMYLFLPSVLALAFVFLAAWLVWSTQIQTAQTSSQQPTAASAVEKVAETTPIDMAEVIKVIDKAGCVACHTIPDVPGAVGQVGPDLSNIGVDAATRREGYSAEEYIHESLKEPNAFTAPEVQAAPVPLTQCRIYNLPMTRLSCWSGFFLPWVLAAVPIEYSTL